jgi:DNA-directed RNA polymerase specialized sigma subunit
MTDLQLVMRSRNGDEDATDELLRRARPVICYMAKRFYIQGQDSDDAVRAAFRG